MDASPWALPHSTLDEIIITMPCINKPIWTNKMWKKEKLAWQTKLKSPRVYPPMGIDA